MLISYSYIIRSLASTSLPSSPACKPSTFEPQPVSYKSSLILTQRSTPPNVSFQVDDIEEQWTYPHKFDYIHSRFMNSSVANWPDLFKKCLE